MQTGNTESPFDILIIGAGAAGLMAAQTLSAKGKKVAVIEAHSRIGGRMYTINDATFEAPVEMGAEFVHGNLPITKGLLREAGIALLPTYGSTWQHYGDALAQQEGFIDDIGFLTQQFNTMQTDMPVADFLKEKLAGNQYSDLRLSLKSYVEGYYAADTSKASTKALAADLEKEEEPQYRVKGGYRGLAQYMEQACRSMNVSFFLHCPVTQLHWKEGEVTAVTPQRNIKAAKAIITISVGVLQEESITFLPALPQKTMAAKALGFGHVVKLNLQFSRSFWKDKAVTGGKDLHELNFLFSSQKIPTWWTQHPQQSSLLTGWMAGPKALSFKEIGKEELTTSALVSLGAVFNIEQNRLESMLQGVQIHNWSADAYFRGAYSYEVVNGAAHIKTLLEPVADTVFFAGEGLHPGPKIGTVEAALASGKEVAEKVGSQ